MSPSIVLNILVILKCCYYYTTDHVTFTCHTDNNNRHTIIFANSVHGRAQNRVEELRRCVVCIPTEKTKLQLDSSALYL